MEDVVPWVARAEEAASLSHRGARERAADMPDPEVASQGAPRPRTGRVLLRARDAERVEGDARHCPPRGQRRPEGGDDRYGPQRWFRAQRGDGGSRGHGDRQRRAFVGRRGTPGRAVVIMVVVGGRRCGRFGDNRGFEVATSRRLAGHRDRRVVAVAALEHSQSGQGEHDSQPPQQTRPGGRRSKTDHEGRLPNDDGRPRSRRRVGPITTPPGVVPAWRIPGSAVPGSASPPLPDAGTPRARGYWAASRTVRSSCALRATTMVEADMRIAPTAGLRVKPVQARTPAASGIAMTL